MTKQTAAGGGMIAIACFMFLSGLGDKLEHLQNFDGLTIAQAIGSLIKDGAGLVIGVLGGTMLPGLGSAAQNVQTLTITQSGPEPHD